MRLTVGMKRDLSEKVAANRFDVRSKAAADAVSRSSSAIYELLFADPRELIRRSPVPAEFFNTGSRFDIEVPYEWYRKFADRHKIHTFDKVSHRETVSLPEYLPLPAGNVDHQGCPEPLFLKYVEAVRVSDQLKIERRKYREALARGIGGVGTLNKLKSLFPDLIEFIPAAWEKKPVKHEIAPTNILAALDAEYGG